MQNFRFINTSPCRGRSPAEGAAGGAHRQVHRQVHRRDLRAFDRRHSPHPAPFGRDPPPTGEGACDYVLAARLCARVMPTPSREERRAGRFAGNSRGGAPVSRCVTPASPFPMPKPKPKPKPKPIRPNKKGSGTPTNAGTTAAPFRCGPPLAGGSPVGVPPRLSPKGVVVPKAQLQAMFPGTRSERVLPTFACPSPGDTSRPGHSAGGLMPEAARGTKCMAPPAGTALAPPPGLPPEGRSLICEMICSRC